MLRLYNALTGKKEEFKPLKDREVRIYTCGPTVYNYAHIGNLRAYVFADILRRTLEYNGYQVQHAMNITDVGHLTSDADEGEDKMVKALRREGKPFTLAGMREVADIYTKAFEDDLRALNCELPHHMPRASEHIKEDIELIQELKKKGFAYRTSEGVYFDTSKFPEYGKLGQVNLEGLKAGARVAVNPEKKNQIDFTLWKFAKPGLPAFPSPFGLGFPGWHSECSAMSRKYLGQPFDIHTGGIDHIPTHHQNEIAQSEAAYGVPLANYWLHNEHLIVHSGKMAKSEENFITLQTFKDRGIHPLAYRYWLLTAHYRSPINFSSEALSAGQHSYFKLLLVFEKLRGNGSIGATYKKRFEERINDDLNTPGGVAVLWELLKDSSVPDADKQATILNFDQVVGLDIENQSRLLKKEMESVPDDIKDLVAAREDARRVKNFKKSDDLRAQIQKEGFEIMDTDSGPIIRKTI